MEHSRKHSKQIGVLDSSSLVNSLLVVVIISLVILGYRGVGFLVVSKSCSNMDEVIVMVDDVSESINIEDGVSEKSAAQIVAQIEDTLAVIGKSQGDWHVILRIVSPDLYTAEDELLTASVDYLEYASDLAVSCLQGEDTWDDLGMLCEKHEEYVNSRDSYFSVVSSVRRRFILDM